jgi:two-component system, cell cycle sensor histidine kinase and response regulator CckA
VHSPSRLDALRRTGLLDSPPEEAFDRLTRLGALSLNVPIALVSLVEDDREFFKSAVGLDAILSGDRSLPASHSFCKYVVASGEPLVVADAFEHPLLRDNPSVREFGVRAYAGVPLITPAGHTLGTFCVVDRNPRVWSSSDIQVLTDLAAAAVTEIVLREQVAERLRAEQESARLLLVLGRERQRVSLLFEQAPAFIATMRGPEHRYEMANESYYQVVGRRDIVGMTVAEAFPDMLQQGFVGILDRVFQTGETFRTNGMPAVFRGDGSSEPDERFVDFVCQALYDEDGSRAGIFCHGIDATDRVRAHQAVSASEERYRHLFDGNPLPMWVYDVDTLRFLAVNEASLGHYGYTRQEFLSMVLTDIRPATDAEFVRASATAAGAGETHLPAVRHTLKDGSMIDVDITSRPIQFGNRPARLVLAHDVTDRERSEKALRDSEAQLRLALDVANLVVWERDLVTDRLSNRVLPRELTTVVPIPAELGTHDGFLAVVHPEDRERVARAHVDAVAACGELSVDFRMLLGDGTQRWKQTVARVLVDSEGQPDRMIGVSRDVTDRAILETQLRHALKMEAVGQLAGGVAHDFNNLLTVITAGVTFAREVLPANTPAFAELAMVDEAAARAGRLTRQLLAFSRKQVLQPELVDLNEIIRGVEPMLRRLIGEDIQIVTIAAAGAPSVFADPGQLEQVLVNLAVNSRDAMPNGGHLIIETSNVSVGSEEQAIRSEGGTPGAYVRLMVRDTGVGMDEATLARAFEPFFTTKEPGRGTGLGLATVYGIVQQSGGTVRVASVVDQGTTFEIDLPRAAEVKGSAAVPGAGAAPGRSSGTILLVEDEAPVRAIARRILARQGYAVIEASNGREALQRAEGHSGEIDMVVTDMVMPEMSGRAFADAFSALHPSTPVLFVSGYTDDEILRRGALAPRTAFLEKPFTPARLLEAVRGMMVTGKPEGQPA